MEEERTKKHGKRKTNTSLGCFTIGGESGISGLLVFGGALAIAGFMAVTSFATKKNNKKKGIHPHHQQLLLNEDQTREDVTSCLTSNECTKTVCSSELLSAQPLILEEKIDNENNSDCFHYHHEEIAFSDYSHPESPASSNENGVVEECSLNRNSSDCEQKEKDESQDGLTTETEDDDDDVTETDEEDSSEATNTTSLDDNEELIEDEFKKYYCERHVCSGLYADEGSHYAENEDMAVQKETILNKTASFFVVQIDQPSILTTWVMPMLLLGLFMLLVLLTRGLQESLYVFDDGNSVVVP